VLDTNVVVSGVLRADGPPGRLLDAVLAGALGLLVDDRILLEYREVLLRPRFGLTAADVDVLLDGLRAEAELVLAPPLGLVLPDADDAPFLEVALAGQADALISGNRRHFPASVRRGVPLLSPAAALARLEPR
jgi:putative PIN family toxin of toxin-antitoxin system